MASLPSSIYDLIAGDPAAKEQDQFGALGNYSTGVGEGLTTAAEKGTWHLIRRSDKNCASRSAGDYRPKQAN